MSDLNYAVFIISFCHVNLYFPVVVAQQVRLLNWAVNSLLD